ncbi:hypothetical protein BCR37DRAFT_384782 [Protomyces lactucae-debilis]|uniref:Uncharacterized protein n=1 Tax=Protomyces lactucae-debilis TaxID=2754530 RepID=A0A1Y2EQ99_PROLT|nr:uncharacterized protein BCR37DRAFT_384782 [Protomyces lactucae-debilis]ORY73464.1 hypothetical protein BCR37DRAFT_384782 [Protomyces lactucae-debilis]
MSLLDRPNADSPLWIPLYEFALLAFECYSLPCFLLATLLNRLCAVPFKNSGYDCTSDSLLQAV